ncbi:FecR domain-containing protein [Cytophagaceae bacterium DM2B3-1]|uniref:FecR domain-containing protein n=1 Tax=Xanthocytophaga flava TaxID=3048013 RepID=A0ABT7CMM5_9BACT|nr:FecR domain-containing protein [Xanthocytophaga flavus]MDJ1494953.1 FecR domain-containing protein [Xanthocytophaga flavus]
MKTELTKDIIFMFLSGNANPLQRKLIEEWLQDERNREQYYDWLEEWEEKHPQFIPDANSAFEKLVTRATNPDTETISTNYNSIQSPFVSYSRKRTSWWVAASVVALLGIGIFWQREAILNKTYQTSYGQIRKVALEDGTIVTLNANSQLQHSRFFFGKGNREVLLKGEAEFSVTHTPDHKRFVVKTPDNLEVEVLGTEFVVFSRQRGSKVILTKGKVQLRTATIQKPVVIHPGDVVTVDSKGSFSLQQKQEVQQYTSWKDHRFVFNRTSVEELVQLLSENFGVSVQITDSTLASRKITGTFQAESAQELLYVVSQAMDLNVQVQQDTFLLSPQ